MLFQVAGAKEIVAFECNPNVFNKLEKTVELNGWNNVKLHRRAASNQSDQEYKFIHVMGNLGGSYIEKTHRQWEGERRFGGYVQTVRVDDVLLADDFQSQQVVVKLDVEGHESAALEGMPLLLKHPKTKHVIIELNPTCNSIDELLQNLEYLSSIGFSVLHLVFNAFEHGWSGEEIVEPSLLSFPPITIEKVRNILTSPPLTVLEVWLRK